MQQPITPHRADGGRENLNGGSHRAAEIAGVQQQLGVTDGGFQLVRQRPLRRGQGAPVWLHQIFHKALPGFDQILRGVGAGERHHPPVIENRGGAERPKEGHPHERDGFARPAPHHHINGVVGPGAAGPIDPL